MSGTLAQDLRYAWRSLTLRRGWSLIALVALALGIGANTAIFSIIDTVLLHPVPFSDPDRLIWLSEQNQKTRNQMNVSLPNFSDWRTQQKSFEGIAAARYDNFNIADSETPVRVRASLISHELFRVLRVNPLRGRALESNDERSGSQRVVVMGYGLWQRRYGGDPSVIGRTIRINAEPYTVVGVMPPGFEFPNSGLSGSEMWAPLRFDGPEASEAARKQRNLMVIGRLAPGVTLEQARSEMESLARQTVAEHPAAGTDMTATVRLFSQVIAFRGDRTLWVLMGAVGCVLLIASANVANLLLARAVGRRREMAIRAAVGASRIRIIRQLLTESLLLAGAAGIVSIAIAVWLKQFLTSLIPVMIIGKRDPELSVTVLAFTLALSLITAILFGLAPAVTGSNVDLREALNDTAGGTPGRSRARLRTVLVVSEVALTMVLLVAAASLVRLFSELVSSDLGFKPARVLTMRLTLPTRKYDTADTLRAFYDQLMEKLTELPRVESAAGASAAPLRDPQDRPMYVTGEPRPDPGREPHVICTAVTPRYFETLQIPMRAGRAFNEHDGPGAPPVAIVNSVAIRKIFAGQNPIGKTVVLLPSRPGEKETLVEVVGVASDTLRFGPGSDSPEEFFIPYRQAPPQRMDLVIRTRTEPTSITAAVQAATASIDKDQPVYNIATMETLLAETVEAPRFNLMLVGFLGVIALILSVIGITGVVSYMVDLRQHEIATRVALGARQRDIHAIFFRYATLIAITGVGTGAILSYVLGRIATGVVFGAAIADPVAIVMAAPLLIATVFAAVFMPARRAAGLDPMKVLRHA